MTPLFIRPMEARDLDTLAALERLCFSTPWSRASFERELSENACARYIVGEAGGRVVAYGGVWLIIDEGHITNIAVHPDFRRMGFGEQITAALMRLCVSFSCDWMTLEVRRSNTAAIALYEKLGFKGVGYRKKYYEDNQEDALIMICEGDDLPAGEDEET